MDKLVKKVNYQFFLELNRLDIIDELVLNGKFMLNNIEKENWNFLKMYISKIV
jgi:hypothetical protein